MQAAIYARRSKDLDNQGKNVEAQVRDMRALALKHGLKVSDDHIYVDNDVSASRFAKRQRTQWKQLLQAVESGQVRNICTLWLNRLLRMPAELELLIDLALAGKFESVHTESLSLDLRTPEGQMMARQMAGFADMEVQQLSTRIKRRMAENRREGKSTRGVVSFGWLGTRHGHHSDDGQTICEDEATLLRSAAEAVLAGIPLSRIAKQWNDAGVPMPMALHRHVKSGSSEPMAAPKWNPGHVQRLLTLPRNAGYQTHDGQVIGQPWPAILDADTYAQLVAHFERRKYGPRSHRSSAWTGFVRCGGTKADGTLCGATMLFTPPSGNRPGSFGCKAIVGRDCCGSNGVSAHHVERIAHEWIVQLLDDDVVRSMCTVDDLNTAQLFGQLQALAVTQAELDEALGAGQLAMTAYRRASESNARQREAVSRQLSTESAKNAMTAYLGRGQFIAGVLASGDMNADEHRALFLATGQHLWVRPQGFRHKTFDTTRLHFGETVPRAWTRKGADKNQRVA